MSRIGRAGNDSAARAFARASVAAPPPRSMMKSRRRMAHPNYQLSRSRRKPTTSRPSRPAGSTGFTVLSRHSPRNGCGALVRFAGNASPGSFMKSLHRRQVLRLAAGATLLPIVSRVARAEAYPSRPVRFIVGVVAGGANSTVARLVAQSLSERLGQQVVVENRPGAGGNVAAEAVAHAAPDGYTLLFSSSANAIGASFNEKPGYDFARAIVPIAGLVHSPLLML